MKIKRVLGMLLVVVLMQQVHAMRGAFKIFGKGAPKWRRPVVLIGSGFVGSALYQTFLEKNQVHALAPSAYLATNYPRKNGQDEELEDERNFEEECTSCDVAPLRVHQHVWYEFSCLLKADVDAYCSVVNACRKFSNKSDNIKVERDLRKLLYESFQAQPTEQALWWIVKVAIEHANTHDY